MAEFQLPVLSHQANKKAPGVYDIPNLPYWARSDIKYAQNLLECSDEPIEYDHEDEDYQDNCFFFPEDCSWSPPSNWVLDDENSEDDLTTSSDSDQHDCDGDTMIPGLPNIKMLDAEALSDLLEDNLSPPEITSILVFATNGAIFAYASSLSSRQLRNLSATYGAAYTCYAKNASSGNLTGVNPASHPSSYVTAQSVSLGDVGSIVFELDDSVAVVTRIADKVLLAAVGPSNLDTADEAATQASQNGAARIDAEAMSATDSLSNGPRPPTNGTYSQVLANATSSPSGTSRNDNEAHTQADAELETQYAIDRSSDLARLASLNLSASPSTLLALESKAAALGRFLSEKLEDLESPEDF
ncbi:uncharacterized protein ACLA_082850 [Aspergillus clavatus NRRL 1]|uniref:Uncharacterized protein n=1 Tax=Aspergillus clavatus (strain ATCC 1007 / CBS 513.65 / DSM 816 / NCTC 3887 / NRRL 1 / QM 1276 / 107) TaxID=344612 RepID=A1CTF7_ASPCL|nr:uncharacterized protein ACLA_082850 [Aspergillus clavatus NRRL 1]EAW06594.1 conserved hypothetical protein [Aspergillus clavatus NRRL 1]